MPSICASNHRNDIPHRPRLSSSSVTPALYCMPETSEHTCLLSPDFKGPLPTFHLTSLCNPPLRAFFRVSFVFRVSLPPLHFFPLRSSEWCLPCSTATRVRSQPCPSPPTAVLYTDIHRSSNQPPVWRGHGLVSLEGRVWLASGAVLAFGSANLVGFCAGWRPTQAPDPRPRDASVARRSWR